MEQLDPMLHIVVPLRHHPRQLTLLVAMCLGSTLPILFTALYHDSTGKRFIRFPTRTPSQYACSRSIPPNVTDSCLSKQPSGSSSSSSSSMARGQESKPKRNRNMPGHVAMVCACVYYMDTWASIVHCSHRTHCTALTVPHCTALLFAQQLL